MYICVYLLILGKYACSFFYFCCAFSFMRIQMLWTILFFLCLLQKQLYVNSLLTKAGCYVLCLCGNLSNNQETLYTEDGDECWLIHFDIFDVTLLILKLSLCFLLFCISFYQEVEVSFFLIYILLFPFSFVWCLWKNTCNSFSLCLCLSLYCNFLTLPPALDTFSLSLSLLQFVHFNEDGYCCNERKNHSTTIFCHFFH